MGSCSPGSGSAGIELGNKSSKPPNSPPPSSAGPSYSPDEESVGSKLEATALGTESNSVAADARRTSIHPTQEAMATGHNDDSAAKAD